MDVFAFGSQSQTHQCHLTQRERERANPNKQAHSTTPRTSINDVCKKSSKGYTARFQNSSKRGDSKDSLSKERSRQRKKKSTPKRERDAHDTPLRVLLHPGHTYSIACHPGWMVLARPLYILCGALQSILRVCLSGCSIRLTFFFSQIETLLSLTHSHTHGLIKSRLG